MTDAMWSKWYYHDGKSVLQHAELGDCIEMVGLLEGKKITYKGTLVDLDMSNTDNGTRIVRYRVCKTKGMAILYDLVQRPTYTKVVEK